MCLDNIITGVSLAILIYLGFISSMPIEQYRNSAKFFALTGFFLYPFIAMILAITAIFTFDKNDEWTAPKKIITYILYIGTVMFLAFAVLILSTKMSGYHEFNPIIVISFLGSSILIMTFCGIFTMCKKSLSIWMNAILEIAKKVDTK